jgi:7,8-dihydropterin-6-yl-methyl-4-(beta-D-ribofuranosyl)aminobenzene 5'-phosphate synthase
MKKMFALVSALFILVMISSGLAIASENNMIASDNLKITVLFDNYRIESEFETSWGFSCLVEGTEKTILFDTGGEADILKHNVDQAGIDLETIDLVFISHYHHDHTGGMPAIKEISENLPVYINRTFSSGVKSDIEELGCEVIETTDPIELCRGVYSTGDIDGDINEQALVVKTDRGLVVITGCAHPGIVKIAELAKEKFDEDILLAMGGFHLRGTSDDALKEIVTEMKNLGVQYIAPSHCSGDNARRQFEEAFGEHYIDSGVGKVIQLSALAKD